MMDAVSAIAIGVPIALLSYPMRNRSLREWAVRYDPITQYETGNPAAWSRVSIDYLYYASQTVFFIGAGIAIIGLNVLVASGILALLGGAQ